MKRFTFDDACVKRVSYILPTKNRSGLLKSALERARDVIGEDDELIVVDGASTDNTAEVVKSFGGLINVFVSEPDNFAYEGSNKGIMLARGKYVYIMTDDDVVYRDGIEKAVEVMERYPEIDLLVCGGIRMFGKYPDPYWLPAGTNYGSRPEDPFNYKACGMGFVHRRRAFAKFGLTDSLAADLDFAVRLIFYGGIVKFCRIKLFQHTLFEYSAVKANKRGHRLARYSVAKKYCSKSFYYKYRLATTINENPIADFYRRGRKALRLKTFGRPPAKRENKTEPIWDGDFS